MTNGGAAITMRGYVEGRNFAEAHRYIIKELIFYGDELSTDYDKENEPPSLDLPMMVEIDMPVHNEPVFSKCAYDSAEGMLRYRDEIVDGTHDHLTDQLSYTYHDRMVDQFNGVAEELIRNRHSRRAQMITWIPDVDLGAEYPPCLQRVWFRERNGFLDMHTHWRSRDAFKAWASNVFGLYFLHKRFAEKLDVDMGYYREFVDSMHIYGRDRMAAESAVNRGIEAWRWSFSDILLEASNA